MPTDPTSSDQLPKPGTLHPPLTKATRTRLLDYLESVSGITTNPKISDKNLISLYDSVASGKGIPVADPGVLGDIVNIGTTIGKPIASAVEKVSSVIDFLNLLLDPHFWVRAAEVVIGAILIAVGAAKLSGAANSVVKATPLGKVL